MYKRAKLEPRGPEPFYERKRISAAKAFASGLDPSGISSFNVGRRAKEHTRNQILGTTAGVVSGVALLPSSVGGLYMAGKGFASTKGGIKQRLLGAAKGFGEGAVGGYKQLYHGFAAAKHLGESQKLKHITPGAVHHLKKVFGVEELPGVVKGAVGSSRLFGGTKQYQQGVGKLRSAVSSQAKMIGAGFGASGAIGGLSSYMQYNQGRDIGNKEISFNRKIRELEEQKKA